MMIKIRTFNQIRNLLEINGNEYTVCSNDRIYSDRAPGINEDMSIFFGKTIEASPSEETRDRYRAKGWSWDKWMIEEVIDGKMD